MKNPILLPISGKSAKDNIGKENSPPISRRVMNICDKKQSLR